MRLAYFLEYPLASQGGVSVLVAALIEALGREFEIVLVSPDYEEDLRAHPAGRLVWRHIRWPSLPDAPSTHFRQTADKIVDEIAGLSVDICHFHCGGIFGWGNRWPNSAIPMRLRKKGVRCVWTNHLVVDLLHGFCGPRKPTWFKLAMLPMAWTGKIQQIAAVHCEICVSDHDVRKVRRWYFPLRRKIRRIYHSRLQPPSSLGEADADEASRESVVLSVGHIAFRKGQHILAEAFADIAGQFPGWELHIAGEIVEEECADHIRATARRNGLENRIKLLGARSDARALMKKAAIFVQPSLQEALGLALQEALWSGCPCLGTKVGGIPELIENGDNGWLVPPDDQGALSEAMKNLLRDEKLRRSFGEKGRLAILQRAMTTAGMIESHREVYRRTLGR